MSSLEEIACSHGRDNTLKHLDNIEHLCITSDCLFEIESMERGDMFFLIKQLKSAIKSLEVSPVPEPA